MRIEPIFVFDLDGTLVDSVYQHVFAWREALEAEGISLSFWRIHRKVGMSGGLLANQLLRETGVEISDALVDRLRERHAAAYNARAASVRPLPGAIELLAWLSDRKIPWAIATSGHRDAAAPALAALRIDRDRTPVVTGDQVKYAKPDPDLFIAAAERLGAAVQTAVVLGDSIWDMLAAKRCKALGVGLLSGGYGSRELQDAGAIRVYEDPADVLRHIEDRRTPIGKARCVLILRPRNASRKGRIDRAPTGCAGMTCARPAPRTCAAARPGPLSRA